MAHLEDLAASHPDLETEVIGQSWEGKAPRVLLSYYYITVDFAKAASRTSHTVTLTGLGDSRQVYIYDYLLCRILRVFPFKKNVGQPALSFLANYRNYVF